VCTVTGNLSLRERGCQQAAAHTAAPLVNRARERETHGIRMVPIDSQQQQQQQRRRGNERQPYREFYFSMAEWDGWEWKG